MATAAVSSQSSGELEPPASNSQSETDRRMAMRQKALEIRIQETRPPVTRINRKAKNAAVSWSSTAVVWRTAEAAYVMSILFCLYSETSPKSIYKETIP